MNIDEITMTTLPKTTTYRYFKEVSWEKYTKLPIKFRNFDVVVRNFIGSKLFTILDPANSKKIKTSETPGINYEITYKNVVGGIELSKVRAPKGLGTAWEASYLGLNPNYQGQGIAKDFYLWLLKNAKYTNVGMIRAGDSQTTGSKKLWQALAKHTLMFAYNPSNRQISAVELNDDGELEADFSIYPGSYSDEQQIADNIRSLEKKLQAKNLTQQQRNDLKQVLSRAKAAQTDLENANSTELYMTMSLK